MFEGWQYAGVFLTAFVLSGVLTPVMRNVARRLRVVDAPDGDRKVQTVPIPYLGGLAIATSASAVLLTAAGLHGEPGQDLPLLIGVLAPAIVLAGVGLLDDLRGLTPLPRFVVQSGAGGVTAAVMAVTSTGIQITGITLFDIALTVLWVIGVTNAFNLLDNTDGAASGTAAIVAGTTATIALLNGQYLVGALALVLAGSCLGFLVWNRFPASIYMGDSGSLFIGFMLAAIAIRIDLDQVPHIQAIVVPLLVLAIPIFDTTLVVLARLRRGLSPFVGGLDHLAHRLRRLGMTVPQTAMRLWGLAAVSGTAAIVTSQASLMVAAGVSVTCAVIFGLGLWLALRLPDTGDLP